MAQQKMRTYEILIKDPVIAEHLPEMDWFCNDKLVYMLNRHSVVYVKPNRGKQGNNIIRIKSCSGDGDKYEIAFEDSRKIVRYNNIEKELQQIMKSSKKYIIQEGIDLATCGGKPFDMRIVLQKIYDAWQLTLTSAKVARHKDDIITNVSKGAKDYLLHEILQSYD